MKLAILLFCTAVICFSCSHKQAEFDNGIKNVKHVVVIYLENHGFDNLYGQFEGADGLSSAAKENTVQVDSAGNAYTVLPQTSADIPKDLPNSYFNIDQYVHAYQTTEDVVHRYYQEQQQIDGGKMDKFVLYNGESSKGLAMGYYKTSLLPLDTMAKQYTLCDRFFHSAFGGSFLNHQWLIAAATPQFKNAPASIRAKMDAKGNLLEDGQVTPDGYIINTSLSVNTPRSVPDTTSTLVPYLTNPTIGDRLIEKGVSWAWYSGGWDTALANSVMPSNPDARPDKAFQYHHQPFIYYKNFAEGTEAKKKYLKDDREFLKAAEHGTLPEVCFVKPYGPENEHPGYSTVIDGERYTLKLIHAVLDNPANKDAVIIITYDENGGFWDHVAPPTIDKWGPGTRVPAIIISPFAKKGFVDHTQYETVSILAFIEKRFGLEPLSDRDKNANPFLNAFDFKQSK